MVNFGKYSTIVWAYLKFLSNLTVSHWNKLNCRLFCCIFLFDYILLAMEFWQPLEIRIVETSNWIMASWKGKNRQTWIDPRLALCHLFTSSNAQTNIFSDKWTEQITSYKNRCLSHHRVDTFNRPNFRAIATHPWHLSKRCFTFSIHKKRPSFRVLQIFSFY